MAVDKQIFDLPIADVSFLQAQLALSIRMATLIQVDGYTLDYEVPLDVLINLVKSQSGSQLYQGSANPDNAAGNNGDVYKQTNGKIYLKAGNVWQVLNGGNANITVNQSSDIPANTSLSYDATQDQLTYTISGGLPANTKVELWVKKAGQTNKQILVQSGTFPEKAYSSTAPATLIYFNWPGCGIGSLADYNAFNFQLQIFPYA